MRTCVLQTGTIQNTLYIFWSFFVICIFISLSLFCIGKKKLGMNKMNPMILGFAHEKTKRTNTC